MTRYLLSHRVLAVAALLALVALGGWLIAGRGTSEAHGVQVNSSPATNQQLTESPGTITVTFSEPIEPSVTTIQLWDTTPTELPLTNIEFPTDDTISASVADNLESGIYTVIWRNLSTVDGHTWAGSFTFTVLGPNGEVPQGTVPSSLQDLAQAPSNSPSALDTTARWIVLLGSAIMLGGAAYVMFIVMPASRAVSDETRDALRKLSLNVLAVTATISVFLVLQGSLIQLLDQADKLGGFSKVNDLLTDTRFGNYLIARQALLLVALLSIGMIWRAGKGAALAVPLVLLLVSSFGVIFTQSMVSHAAGADGAFWKISADLLHIFAASLWVGGLIHIGLAMPRWLDQLSGATRTLFAAESFRRFSVLAMFSVVIVVASGVLSALAQFTSFGQLFDTSYGWSLVAKIALMIPMLIVGGVNAGILQPRIVDASLQMRGAAVDDNTPATGSVADLQRLLANTIRIEAVLGIIVLVAVGVLTQLEPPRAEAEAEAASAAQVSAPQGAQPSDPNAEARGYFLKAAQVGGLVISLKIDPARVGNNAFEVGLGSEFGSVGEVELVQLTFDHEDPEIGQSELELPLFGSAKFATEGTNMSIPGTYTVSTTVRRRGEDDVTTDFTIPVGEGTSASSDGNTSIWDWPFEDRRSPGAIAALAAGGAGLVLAGAFQARNYRRKP